MRNAAGIQLTTAAMAAFLFISAAPAQAKPPRECAAEIEEYCEDVPFSKINRCLREHVSKLSTGCATALDEAEQRASDQRKFRRTRPKWLDPCIGDIRKLCNDIPAGRGRIAECLTNHHAELSIACRLALTPPTP